MEKIVTDPPVVAKFILIILLLKYIQTKKYKSLMLLVLTQL